MRKLWNLFSLLAAMAILAIVLVTVSQTPLQAQKGGAKAAAKNLKVLTPENLMDQMLPILKRARRPERGRLQLLPRGGPVIRHHAYEGKGSRDD